MTESAPSGDSILACPVCLGRYDEGGSRPKLLHCGHTFCLGCLREITKEPPAGGQGDHRRIACPVCRQATALPGKGVAHLADNFAVVGLVSGGRGEPEPGSYCEEHPDQKVKFFCLSCHRLLCPCCALQHKSQTPHHNIEDAESAALRYRRKIRFALDYCREKQMLLDKLVRESVCEGRQLSGLSLSLEHLVNNASDRELLSQSHALSGLEGCVPPRRPPSSDDGRPAVTVIGRSNFAAPPAFWPFTTSPRGNNCCGNLGPRSLDTLGPTSDRVIGEEGGTVVPMRPTGVAVTPDGVVLVTGCTGGSRWTGVLGPDALQGVAFEGRAGADIAVSALGYLVVLARPQHRCVSVRARDGRRLFSLRLGWRRPFGVAVTSKGQVVVSDRSENGTLSVLTIDWTSGAVLHLQLIGGLRYPSFVACGGGRTAVSTDTSVHLYDGMWSLVWTSAPGGGTFHPAGISIDSEGNIIVADSSSGKVFLLGKDGRCLKCVVQGLTGPQGLALGPNGVLVIANHENSTIITHSYQPPQT